jgi:hypothetical protein
MIPRQPTSTTPASGRARLGETPPPPSPASTTGAPRSPAAPSGEFERLSLRPRPPGGGGSTLPPRAGLPPSSGSTGSSATASSSASSSAGAGAAPSPTDALSAVRTARRNMGVLLDRYEQCQTALSQANAAQGNQDRLVRLDQLMDAGREILALYASLPRHTAVRVLTDDEVRTLRDDILQADAQHIAISNPALLALNEQKAKDADLLARMVKLNETRDTPLDLSRIEARLRQNAASEHAWWEQKAMRCERVLAVCSMAAGLPSTSATDRAAEETELRDLSGRLLFAQFIALNTRAELALSDLSHLVEPSPGEGSDDDGSLVSTLQAFRDDIRPAFQSTVDDVVRGFGRPLQPATCAVLEGVVGRLAEFASTLERQLGEEPAAAGSPLAELQPFIEGAWITASEVTRLLARQPNAAGLGAPPGSAAVAAPAETGTDAAPLTDAAAEGPASSRRKKKRRPAQPTPSAGASGSAPPSASSSAAAPPQPQAPAGPAKVLARSALGTQVLADAVPSDDAVPPGDSQAEATAQAGPVAAVTPPAETLAQRLARLEALVGFDLPAQQREVSRARRELAPESAQHVAEAVARRLAAQATEMAACLAEWEDQGLRRTLSSAQQDQVHTQTRRLRVLLADVRGQAKALQDGMAAATLDHMKTYAFPTQAHVAQLLQAGELAADEPPRALKGEPGTLFELKLQPAALRNGVLPRPIWLHVHTARPVRADQLATLDDRAFAASHVKSDAGRGHNRQWQDAQAAAGRDNVLIHRGKISPALCRTLLGPGSSAAHLQ